MTISGLTEQESKCITSLNAPDYRRFRARKVKEQAEGTLEWVQRNNLIRQWRTQKKSSVLWIRGSPGQGKTVLSKYLVQYMENTIAPVSDAHQHIVIYFFFYNQDPDLRSVSALLRSLIDQILIAQPLFQHILPIYERRRETFTLSNETLWGIFKAIVQDPYFENIYCVLDALDECEDNKDARQEFLSMLFEPFSEDEGNRRSPPPPFFKLLITSRPEKDLHVLNKLPKLIPELEADPEDVTRHISNQISALPDYFTTGIKQKIETKLQEKSETTFLWCSFVFKEISDLDQPTIHKLIHTIDEIPGRLESVHQKVSSALMKRPEACQLLVWAVFARRPLTLLEIQEALAASPVTKNRHSILDDMAKITEESTSRVAGAFLKVYDQRVEFIHKSAREFLITFGPLVECQFLGGLAPNAYIGRVCMAYLNFEEFEDIGEDGMEIKEDFDFLPEFGLYKYAAVNWYLHIEKKDIDHVQEQLYYLVDPCNVKTRAWYYMNQGYLIKKEGWSSMDIALQLDIEWLGRFVFSNGNRKLSTEIRYDVLQHVLSHDSDSYIEFLIQDSNFRVTEASLVAAASLRLRGKEILDLMLSKDYGIQITERVVVTAARNLYNGKRIIEFLFSKDPSIQISEKVLIALLRNIFRLSFMSPGIRANEQLLQLLLKKLPSAQITEAVVTAAAASTCSGAMVELLLHKVPEVQITEALIAAASGNRYCSEHLIRLLLRSRKTEIKTTPKVVRAAALNNRNGTKIIKLLLSECTNLMESKKAVIALFKEFRSTEEIVEGDCSSVSESGDEAPW